MAIAYKKTGTSKSAGKKIRSTGSLTPISEKKFKDDGMKMKKTATPRKTTSSITNPPARKNKKRYEM